eukprot:m.99138 g.99138  ORF g.99138 m.99138 type:complete len:332 (+) comp27132_c0_seq1:148-1143(+)
MAGFQQKEAFDPGMFKIEDDSAMKISSASPTTDVAISESTGSLHVLLHPLVIINISEHYTRIRAQHNQGVPVFGFIMGVQDGRRVEVFNSFEIIVEGNVLQEDYMIPKLARFKEVFKTLHMLGWYTTGAEVTANHLVVHKQVMKQNEGALFLLLDPSPKASARELPLNLYEPVMEFSTSDEEQNVAFTKIGYTLATEEAERIGVDHVAKQLGSTGSSQSSEVTMHLQTHRSAMGMLRERIIIIRNYLVAVNEGKLPRNNQILREISALSSRLPIGSDADARQTFMRNTNDAMLVSYMAMVTKGFNAMSEVLDKLPIVYERGINRRGRSWAF